MRTQHRPFQSPEVAVLRRVIEGDGSSCEPMRGSGWRHFQLR